MMNRSYLRFCYLVLLTQANCFSTGNIKDELESTASTANCFSTGNIRDELESTASTANCFSTGNIRDELESTASTADEENESRDQEDQRDEVSSLCPADQYDQFQCDFTYEPPESQLYNAAVNFALPHINNFVRDRLKKYSEPHVYSGDDWRTKVKNTIGWGDLVDPLFALASLSLHKFHNYDPKDKERTLKNFVEDGAQDMVKNFAYSTKNAVTNGADMVKNFAYSTKNAVTNGADMVKNFAYGTKNAVTNGANWMTGLFSGKSTEEPEIPMDDDLYYS